MSVAAVLLTTQLGLGAPPVLDDEQIVEAINEAYESRDYARAILLLDEAYARDPRPAYLYSKGEILVAADDCVGAIAAFEAFLATDPPGVDAAATREKIERCEPPGPEPPPPTVVAPAPPPSRPERHRRPLADDPVFIALMTVGAGVALTGASVLVAARITADVNGSATTEQAWEDGVKRVRGLSIGGAVIVGVGGGLIIGAIARAIVVSRRYPSSRSGGKNTSRQ